ncbi:hypothetical protein ACFQPG_02635 [Sphingomonas sp. GCM10030256]|uniref:hypothetical protein n=1 Tax=Sphingomonas sp. GCM10030256 TaxID=3273427 RepID=UPI00361B78DF
MLLLTLLAATIQPPATPRAQSRSTAQATIRILQAASVEGGRTREPHTRGRARVADPGEAERVIPLVEFQ